MIQNKHSYLKIFISTFGASQWFHNSIVCVAAVWKEESHNEQTKQNVDLNEAWNQQTFDNWASAILMEITNR